MLATTKPATLYVSEAVLAEYRGVLARPELKIRKVLQQRLLQMISSRSHLVKPSRILRVTKGPDVLECADAARANYLVTGNQRNSPKFWKRTKVITSRESIDIVAPRPVS